MAYVPVPKDLTKIKTKVLLNLTKRQLICFSLGALVGVPIFFLLKPRVSISAAAIVMIVASLDPIQQMIRTIASRIHR